MDTLIKSAVKGQRKAMEALYDASKQKAYQVAYQLVKDETTANNAVSTAYRSIFANLEKGGFETQKDFTDAVVIKTADNCKKIILKKNSKAYQFPEGKNFTIRNPKSAESVTDNYADFVYGQFTELQKMIFVLHTIGELDNKGISVVTKLDAKTVDIALKAEKENVTSIVGGALTYEAICESFIRSEKDKTVSSLTDSDVKKVIADISAPAEKSKKVRLISIIAIVLAACLLIGGGVWMFSGNGGSDESADESSSEEVKTSLDTNTTYYADIDIKDYGKITVKLDQKQAPLTVENFVNLAKSGFYDGLTFHRIMEGFMMQGGDPDGNGTGGNKDKDGNKIEIKGEFKENGVNNTISHTRGVISMARATPPNTASSQFFIVHEDSTFLDGKYAGFGYVTEGLEVVDKVCEEAEPTDNNGAIPKDKQPIINKITIREVK